MNTIYKLIAGAVFAAVLACGPAAYVHIKDNAAKALALKQQADGYNANAAQLAAASSAQKAQLDTRGNQAANQTDQTKTHIQQQTIKTVIEIKHAPPTQCLDAPVPAGVLDSLRKPPDLRP